MIKLAASFDQARAATPSNSALNLGTAAWGITSNSNLALNASFMSGSSTQAIGGDLAWRYATLNTGAAVSSIPGGLEASYGNLDTAAVRNRMNSMGSWQNWTANTSTVVNPWIALQAGTSLMQEQATGASPTLTPVQALSQDQLISTALVTQQQITAVARPTWV